MVWNRSKLASGGTVQRWKPMLACRWLVICSISLGVGHWTPASAQPGVSDGRLRPEKACAAYDLHLLTLIEDHGRAQEMRPEEIYAAMITVVEARTACRNGDFDRAHRLYSLMDLGLTGVAPSHWVVLR